MADCTTKPQINDPEDSLENGIIAPTTLAQTKLAALAPIPTSKTFLKMGNLDVMTENSVIAD